MVLLLLALGSLLLQGMNQQQRSLLAQVSAETQAIRDTAAAQSALQWGKGVNWPLQCSCVSTGKQPTLARVSAAF